MVFVGSCRKATSSKTIINALVHKGGTEWAPSVLSNFELGSAETNALPRLELIFANFNPVFVYMDHTVLYL